MFSRLRERLGTPGLVAVIVALIVLPSGIAYAKGGGLTKKQIKEVEKIAKKFAGKDGKDGAPGATGPGGPKGDKGDPGSAGTSGATGAQGVAGATGPGGATGPKGATGQTGPTGVTGPEGVCSTSACILPSEVTETGTWSVLGVFAGAPPNAIVSFPFSIPLATELGSNSVHYIGNVSSASGTGDTNGNEIITNAVGGFQANQYLTGTGIAPNTWIKEVNGSELIISKAATSSGTGVALAATQMPPSGCTAGTVAEPKADPGNLCVYAGIEAGSTGGEHQIFPVDNSLEGASRSGASMLFKGLGSLAFVYGSWAVTAP
jgi:hypothetical protein